jgi:hypothetical protein
MKSHFGEESLIMYSKSCDYFQINPIKREDIQMYYEYLMSDLIKTEKKAINDLSCCLYYLAKSNKEYQEKFTSQIIERIDINEDKINDDTLVLIYNIIEFDEQYLKSDRIKLEYLLSYLERFSTFAKSRTNFLLYKYYRGILKLNLGDPQSANSEYLEIVMSYNDEIIEAGKETKYTQFIQLKNDLLNIRITKILQGDDIHQTRIFLKELYDRTKNENQFLAIKIGFELYDIFLKDNKYNDCIDILINMRNILKKRLLTGIKMDNAIDFYLSIISRLGYIGILTNNKGSIDNSIKKLKKSVDMFNKFTEENKDKSITLKKAYSFLLTILKINNNEKVEKQKEIAANFKSAFLPDLKKVQQNKFIGQFIINESNFYECVVNLNIINNMEYDTETFLKKEIYLPMLTTVTQNNPLQHKYVMTFILNVHNQINHYTESYCTDFNKDIYKDKIKDLTEKTLSYVRNYGIDEPIFHTQFIKGVLLNIFSAYAHVHLYNKEFNKLKNLIKFIDDLNRTLKFNENTPSYELLCKIKGDFWLFNSMRDINASISFYEKALKLLPNSHPKKPIILFNMGYCHFLNDDKKKAVDYLGRCINEFNNLEPNKSPFDFYYRPNALTQKVKTAKKIINLITSGQ